MAPVAPLIAPGGARTADLKRKRLKPIIYNNMVLSRSTAGTSARTNLRSHMLTQSLRSIDRPRSRVAQAVLV